MTESPIPPRRSPRRPWLLAIFAAGAAATVGVVLLVSHLVSPAPTATLSAQVTTPPAATTTMLSLDLSPEQQTAQRQADDAVAMDGIPVDWSTLHLDAYEWTSAVCAYFANYPGGPTAVNWYQISIPGVMTRGGMLALVTAAPYVCPQYARFFTSSAHAFFPGP